MLGQETSQVYGGAMSITKINRQDTQHFRDQSTLFYVSFLRVFTVFQSYPCPPTPFLQRIL